MNRLLAFGFLSCFSLILSPHRAFAQVINVPASADSEVDALLPNSSFPTGDLAAAKEGPPETQAIQLTFFYAQFNLPAGTTGQSFSSVNSAQFTVFQNGPDFSLTYHVYAVNDGLDAASADTYTWNQSVGFDPTHTLVKFLTADEISYYSDPAESTFVGTLDTGAAGPGPIDFTSIPQSPTAAAALKSFILADTDGRLTFFVGVRQNFGVTAANTFASIESLTVAGPTFTLDAVRVPEPSTLLLAGCLAALAAAGRRRLA